MAINLEIKHNDTSITNIQSGGVALNTAGKVCNDSLSFTLSGAEFWQGDLLVLPDKPTNLTPSATYDGNEHTNGYTCPSTVTMTGQDRGTAIGSYIANYTPNSGITWSDGTTESVTVVLTIATMPQYLCFTANTDGSTIAMSVTGTPVTGYNFQTSLNGENWTDFVPGSTTITLVNVGDKVYFKGNNPNGVSADFMDYCQFVMTGSIAASGNIMSLIDNGACTCTTIPNEGCFVYLFLQCASLTTAPELPATTLSNNCYEALFSQCTSLTTPPALPATTLANQCYYNMFNNCASLQVSDAQTAEAPYAWRIPTSETFINTYSQTNMFKNCLGTRSSNNMSGSAGQSYTYYTQNTPVS